MEQSKNRDVNICKQDSRNEVKNLERIRAKYNKQPKIIRYIIRFVVHLVAILILAFSVLVLLTILTSVNYLNWQMFVTVLIVEIAVSIGERLIDRYHGIKS